eukprot:351691-Chlamydomonas_euryale.AAC.4
MGDCRSMSSCCHASQGSHPWDLFPADIVYLPYIFGASHLESAAAEQEQRVEVIIASCTQGDKMCPDGLQEAGPIASKVAC